LAPHPDEKPYKKKTRILTWASLILDLTAAIVAITTYNGVTICCEQPMMNIAGKFNWSLLTEIVTYMYILLILLEAIPVVRDGFPFNLFNPLMGFLITFAVFFNDSIVEAISMWVIETMAVACEAYIFRLKSYAYHQRLERLEKTEQEILKLRKIKKAVKTQYESGRNLMRGMSASSFGSLGSFSDEGSAIDKESFHDEPESGENKSLATDISRIRETKLYRERRVLRESNALDRRHLRYHLIGVSFDVFLVCVTLLLICTISKNGGLCIVDMKPPNVFKNDQLDRCYHCQGVEGTCEICGADGPGSSQCYYPYV
jgi:hypothetical protein